MTSIVDFVPIITDKTITCPLCCYQKYTNNQDLDSDYHKGFTIGTKGRKMYWMMIWHASGHATVYSIENPPRGRWVHGDTIITIHLK